LGKEAKEANVSTPLFPLALSAWYLAKSKDHSKDL